MVASEILEHVSDPEMFLSSCCQLIKVTSQILFPKFEIAQQSPLFCQRNYPPLQPNGSMFITTINKTALSRALAVFAAERVFKVVPAGSHDWDKFVTPQETQEILQKGNCRLYF